MNNDQRTNEALLDFSGLFREFVMQWKAILVFSIIVSLLVTGAKYKRDTNAYKTASAAASENNITAEQAKQRISDTLDSLSKEDRAAVEYAYGFHSMIEDKLAYQAESPIMTVDPNHTNILTLVYRVTGDFGLSVPPALNDGYLSVLNNPDMLAEISKATSRNIDPDYLRELLSFADPNKGLAMSPDQLFKEDNSFSVYVIVPEGEDSTSFRDTISKAINKKCSELSKRGVPHTVEMVSDELSSSVCNTVMTRQQDVYYSVSYLSTSLDASLSGLTPVQAAAYNTLLQLQPIADGKVDAAAAAESSMPDIPRISKKSLIEGLVIGVLLYFLIFVIYTLFRENIGSSKVAKSVLHKRLLGEYYEMPETDNLKLLERLMFSSAVFKHRYKGCMDLEMQTESVVKALVAARSRDAMEKVSMIYTAEGQETFADSIRSVCKKEDLDMDIIDDKLSMDDSALRDVENAIISVSNSTKAKKLYELTELLDYCGINVLGFVYTADR